jgi:hypothetical protein
MLKFLAHIQDSCARVQTLQNGGTGPGMKIILFPHLSSLCWSVVTSGTGGLPPSDRFSC